MIATRTNELLSRDAFLSEHLARDVRRVDMKALSSDPAQLSIAMNELAAPAMAYAKAPADVPSGVEEALCAEGFAPIDTAVTLERPRILDDVDDESFEVRSATAADEVAVVRLAEAALTTSRFSRDPCLTAREAARVKSAWARSYFEGTRGEAMVVACHPDDGVVMGFLLALSSPDRALVIDLVAVDARARRRGVGRAMTIEAQRHFVRAERLRVGTQGSNTSALMAYQRMGFKVVREETVWHAHVMRSARTASAIEEASAR
jgi:ribosomal protein S18 acetylase RimI-like enzyme